MKHRITGTIVRLEMLKKKNVMGSHWSLFYLHKIKNHSKIVSVKMLVGLKLSQEKMVCLKFCKQ